MKGPSSSSQFFAPRRPIYFGRRILFRTQDHATDDPQAMTRWVSSTWCRHMGPTPPRAADRWGHGCLSIFPVCACPDQTRRLQIIPPLYPLPLSLLHHLAALLRISAYPLPLSLSLSPSSSCCAPPHQRKVCHLSLRRSPVRLPAPSTA
jgi:hypothetical protein